MAENFDLNNSLIDVGYNDKYSYIDNTILLYTGNRNVGIEIIPSEINGRKITKIARNAFCHTSPATLVIPETITEVNYQGIHKMQELVIPGTLNKLDSFSMTSVDKITVYNIPLSIDEYNAIINSSYKTFDDRFVIYKSDLLTKTNKVVSTLFNGKKRSFDLDINNNIDGLYMQIRNDDPTEFVDKRLYYNLSKHPVDFRDKTVKDMFLEHGINNPNSVCKASVEYNAEFERLDKDKNRPQAWTAIMDSKNTILYDDMAVISVDFLYNCWATTNSIEIIYKNDSYYLMQLVLLSNEHGKSSFFDVLICDKDGNIIKDDLATEVYGKYKLIQIL